MRPRWRPASAGASVFGMSDAPRTEQPPEAKKRPTALIVLCAVLALAVIGLAVWAFSAQSDADDAEAKLAEQQRAAAQATPEPGGVSDEAEAAVEQVATELGVTDESIDDIQQQIDAAKAKVDAAQVQREQASGAVDTAKAELESFKAKAEQAQACLKGSLDALSTAVDAGGVDAAVQELQQIAGSCRSAAAP
jgi:uncharacterized protein HemX